MVHHHRTTTMRGHPPRTARVTGLLLAAAIALAPGAAMADTGMDVSKWQGCVTASAAAQAKAGGTAFAFVKVSEGAGYADSVADCTMQGLAAAGIRRGVYHYARPDLGNTPEAEADWFISQTRGYIGQGVIPVLDWEPGGSYNTWTWWAKRWLDRVQAAWGVKPLIYMSASVIRTGDWSAVANADYGLWVAGYPAGYTQDRLRDPGAVPYDVSPWKFAAAWQYSSSGRVPGVGERIDVNWFYGDAATWARYAGAEHGTNANPTPSEPADSPQQGAPTGDVESLARAVIRGDYGNMPQRKVLLGGRYDEVQARVDQILAGSATTSQTTGQTAAASTRVTVRAGDTLSAIAARTGLWPLSAWSVPSGDRNRIWPGQTVVFTGAAAATSQTPTGGGHVVRAGESLWSIYGTGWSAAAARNGIAAPYVIHPGQVLR